MSELTKEQKALRYAISCDIDAMKDEGYTKLDIIDWFRGNRDLGCNVNESYECVERGIYPTTGERIIEVFFEVVKQYNIEF